VPKSKSRKKKYSIGKKSGGKPNKNLGIFNLILLGVVAVSLSIWGISQIGQ
tara:strand:+ start:258 stop:410 length:153 start_codon:yes stop_codon:yes gene_type:complete